MTHVHVLATSSIHGALPLLGSFLTAAAAKKSSTSSSLTLIFFVLLFGVGYMFLIRPQRQRRQRAAQVSKQISVGDRVMLTSGIIGRVEGFVGDRAKIEIAPGLVIEVVRQAVSQRLDADVDADLDHSSTSYDEGDHDDLVDDSDHDPYSVPPLEASHTTDSGEDDDGGHPSGNGSGGGTT